jgi:hypothetical protein
MPIDKAKLGIRYTCFQCAAKFYDLNRPEPMCPSCGADQREDPNPDPIEEMLRSLSKRRRRKKKKVEATSEPESDASFFPDFGGDGDKKDGDKKDAATKDETKG